MKKTLHSPEAAEVREFLVGLRKRAGLTQRALARVLGVLPSEIAKLETRERRLDVVQLYRISRALGLDPTRTAGHLFRAFDQVQRKRSR